MKQYHIETKKQSTGEWRLYDRVKCTYLIDLSNQDAAEDKAKGTAIRLANFVNRKRRFGGPAVVADPIAYVAVIETRIVEVTFVPNATPLRTLIWENGEFTTKR